MNCPNCNDSEYEIVNTDDGYPYYRCEECGEEWGEAPH